MNSSNLGYKIQKKMWLENILVRKNTKGIRVKRRHNKYKILNYIEKTQLLFNDLLMQSNCTALWTCKAEERNFGTPCRPSVKNRKQSTMLSL